MKPRKNLLILLLPSMLLFLAGVGICLFGCSQMEAPAPTYQIKSVKVFEPAYNIPAQSDESAKADESELEADGQSDSPISQEYHRGHLTDFEQGVYDELRNGFSAFTSDIDITDCDPDSLARCYKYVLADHPEIFWVDNSYQYMITQDRTRVVSVQPDYIYQSKETEGLRAEIQRQATEIISSMPAEAASDYDKARHIFTMLSDMLIYDEAMADYQDLGMVFTKKTSACGGYSKAYQYICRLAGIETTYLTGYADVNGESILHAWNMQDLDGVVCYADITWGDKEEKLPVDCSWLGLTLDSISLSHHALDESLLIESSDPVYEAWTITDSSYAMFDEQTVITKLIESVEKGQPSIVLRFTTPELAEQASQSIKGNPLCATQIYERFPDRFPVAFTEGVYKAYKIDDLNAVKVIWKY